MIPNPPKDVRPTAPAKAAYLSIGGLSRATGVPVETLRTWELRYGFPKSVRKPSGHRLFSVESVDRIRRIGFALERGLRAGEVVPASEAVIETLMAAVPAKPIARAPSRPFDSRAFLDVIRDFDADRLMRSLQSDLVYEDPLAYLETRIVPCLNTIGDAWTAGTIDIAHEHFAAERISDLIRRARLRFEETARGPLVALATLPGEAHGLGLQMAALILSARGLSVLSLGAELPIGEIAAMAVRVEASAVGISVSSLTSKQAAAALPALRSKLARSIALIVGGAGAPEGVKGTTRVADLRALDAWAKAQGGRRGPAR